MARAGETARERACPLGTCDGSGWVLGPEDVARPCECRAQRLRKGRGKGVASVIPPRYRGVSFDRPPVSDMPGTALQRVKRFIRNLDENLSQGRGMWFTGDIGTGKTTLAMLISKTALESGHSVAIYSMPKLLARIRRTFDSQPGTDSYTEFFEKLTAVDLLHIDDVGAERQTEWVLEQFYSIVNERYEAQRSIIFTTNAESMQPAKGKEEQFKVEEQINPRTFSRLTEMCGDPVLMFGEDHRTNAVAAAG